MKETLHEWLMNNLKEDGELYRKEYKEKLINHFDEPTILLFNKFYEHYESLVIKKEAKRIMPSKKYDFCAGLFYLTKLKLKQPFTANVVFDIFIVYPRDILRHYVAIKKSFGMKYCKESDVASILGTTCISRPSFVSIFENKLKPHSKMDNNLIRDVKNFLEINKGKLEEIPSARPQIVASVFCTFCRIHKSTISNREVADIYCLTTETVKRGMNKIQKMFNLEIPPFEH